MKKYLLCLLLVFIVNSGVFSGDIEDNQKERERRFTIQTSPHFYLADLITLGAGNGTCCTYWPL